MNDKDRNTLAELALLLEQKAAPMETFEFGKLPFAEIKGKVESVHLACLHVAQSLRFFSQQPAADLTDLLDDYRAAVRRCCNEEVNYNACGGDRRRVTAAEAAENAARSALESAMEKR